MRCTWNAAASQHLAFEPPRHRVPPCTAACRHRVHAILETALDWDSFSIRLPEAAFDERLPALLLSIPRARIARMQHHLASVMHR